MLADSAGTEALERSYRILSGDDSDERACEAIPDSACTDLPRNYLLNVANGSCTKLAEQLAGPNLVLPWLLAALGTPASITGWLMPVKQLFSLVPQLAVSGRIRRVGVRRRVWTAAGLSQAAALLAMAAAAVWLPPLEAGLAVLALLAVFSAASGAGSVAFQDVMGKTVPKGRRGRLLSNRALIGGALTIAAGLGLQYQLGAEAPISVYVWLLLGAAGLWALAALLFAAVREAPGATEGGRSPLAELGAGWALVRSQPGYRHFLTVRALLLSVEIGMPLFVLHGRAVSDGTVLALGVFMLAVGAGNVLSSPVWGRFSDRSSRQVLEISGLLAAAIAVLALGLGQLAASQWAAWLYAPVFVLLGIAEQGVRLGRKTYLVDAAPKDQRPLYTAFANTSVGLLALLGGALGFLAQWLSPAAAVVALGLLGLAGALAARALPEASEMLDFRP